MAKVNVILELHYGYYSNYENGVDIQTIEIEVSDNELEALKKLGKEQISTEDVVAAIESGDSTLKSLHEQLSEKFYYMVEEYWLYEADNEFLYDNLEEHIEQDIEDGLYTPEVKEGDGFDCHCWTGDEDDDEDSDDENEEEDNSYDLDAYYRWVQEHDHEFAAERVGLDLDACREDEVNYTIELSC